VNRRLDLLLLLGARPAGAALVRAINAASACATSKARLTSRSAVCSSAWPNTPLPSTDRMTMRA